MTAAIEQYDRKAAVGVLGSRFVEPLVSYHRSRVRAATTHGLPEDWLVHVLGTGTLAYHTSTLRIGAADLPRANMTDVWFAVYAKRRGIPLVAINRPPGWLEYLPPPAGTTIYERTMAAMGRDAFETSIVQSVAPWPVLDRARLAQMSKTVSEYGMPSCSSTETTAKPIANP
jgi:hypothetical protein